MTDAAPLPAAIEAFLASLAEPESSRTLRALCEVIVATDPRLDATIKWNAPSFTLDGRDVVTTGVNRDGSVRLVLHRGAAKAAPGTERPIIDDPAGLLEWRGVDRALSSFASADEVAAHADAIRSVVTQWLAATEGGAA